MPVEHFQNKKAEMKNLAFRHMAAVPYTATTACIGTGKNERCHRVKHSDSKSRRHIDAAQRRKVARRKYSHHTKKMVAKRR